MGKIRGNALQGDPKFIESPSIKMTLLDYINKHHGGNQSAFGRLINKDRQHVSRMLKDGNWYYNEDTGWLEHRPVYAKFNLGKVEC